MRERIVYIDLDAVGSFVARTLAGEGYSVEYYPNPNEALESIGVGADFDMGLVDVSYNGLGEVYETLLEKLKMRNPNAPIITMGIEEEEPENSDCCIRKPFKPEMLVDTVNTIMAANRGKPKKLR